MTTIDAGDALSYVHEAGFYNSEAEFAELIVGFVDDAVARNEPVIIGYDQRKNDIVRSSIVNPGSVTFIEDASLYSTPARAIAGYRRQFEKHIADGARRIRIAGDVPHPGNGRSFDGWDRYEWAINSVWEPTPVWSRCLYDATSVPPAVRAAVHRTHRQLIAPGDVRSASQDYADTDHFQALPVELDPLEHGIPALELLNPTPADLRAQLRRIGDSVRQDILQDLLLAASEAVANAQQHGGVPCTVRIWAAAQRLVIRVHDTGTGPSDRAAGLVPKTNSRTGAGLGLWISHQLDIATDLIWAPDGFTVRLRST